MEQEKKISLNASKDELMRIRNALLQDQKTQVALATIEGNENLKIVDSIDEAIEKLDGKTN